MQDFIPGQRWICSAELQMGLGTVLGVEHRTVDMLFLATGETRTYARQTAPLTRVVFGPGDRIPSQDGWILTVESVLEHEGLMTYCGLRDDGEAAVLEEGQINNFIQLNRPGERLLTGQIDRNKWFELRYRTRIQQGRLLHSDLYGLAGARTSLLPHQLYIAREVARRYAPRVLLADEVGLGKTIEAGLILHQQLLTERARRVLIVVPETLVHQWLVEMLRRFNLHFSVFNEARCADIEGMTAAPDDGLEALFDGIIPGDADNEPVPPPEQRNPFHSEQRALCSLEFLRDNPQRHQQALEGDWDLLVVDEAHHLQWTPESASPEYQIIEALAAQTRGVLLLTATPEQLGKAGHFARLRLLDPDRFHDFASFEAEEEDYRPIAHTVETLLDQAPLDSQSLEVLNSTLQEGDNQILLDKVQADPDNTEARHELVAHLLDRHGTGRVLFRNTRAAIQGFPERRLQGYPLSLPDAFREAIDDSLQHKAPQPGLLLCPELLYILHDQQRDWTAIDPRVGWLGKTLKSLHPHKVLVITANAGTALDLETALRVRTGMHAAVFHEGMSLIERDRAAAFFADQEFGSQVLICSEIGSEGRNFQFAHHLILFDLPFNPDLLEQRIGRLDRIGQEETIHIHVPYFEHSAQAIMYHWYHEGLNAFEHTCPAGHSVFTEVQDALRQALLENNQDQALIERSHTLHSRLNAAMHLGRDRLLEHNSCRPGEATQLVARAEALDAESTLAEYMEQVFDCHNIDSDIHSDHSLIITPGNHMQAGSVPGLPEDGMTITFDRTTALRNEDIQFLSWEHPLVSGAMDMILGNEQGNTAAAIVKYNGVKPGTLLLECLYIMESASSSELLSSRYLPTSTIRIVMAPDGSDHEARLTHDEISSTRVRIDRDTGVKLIQARGRQIRDMLGKAGTLAEKRAAPVIEDAHKQVRQTLEREIHRLRALRRVNPNVREDEIDYFEIRLELLNVVIESCRPQLDGCRILVAT